MLVGCGQAGGRRRRRKLISFLGLSMKKISTGVIWTRDAVQSRARESSLSSTVPRIEFFPSLLSSDNRVGGRAPCILRPPARPRAAPVTPACHAVPLPFPCPVPRPVSLCHSIYPFLYSQAPRAKAPSYPNENRLPNLVPWRHNFGTKDR